MNETPDRQSRNTYPFHFGIDARFTDTDLGGHLNNVSLVAYYQDGLARFMLDCFPELIGDPGWGVRLARCDVSYDGQTFYPDPIEVATGIADVGDNWVRVAQALFQRGQSVGQSDSILVIVGRQGQSLELSLGQRTRLEARRLRS